MDEKIVTINVKNFGEIHVTAYLKGECKGTKMFNHYHYLYNLVIWSEHGKMEVDFHDCAANFPKVKELNREALLDALDCILSDISMFLNDEIEGLYDDLATIKQVTNGCKSEYEKFIKVAGSEDNVWDLIMKLTDYIRGDEEEDEE